jgi:hypothetical protein
MHLINLWIQHRPRIVHIVANDGSDHKFDFSRIKSGKMKIICQVQNGELVKNPKIRHAPAFSGAGSAMAGSVTTMDFVFCPQNWLICHSGLDPESIVITKPWSPGCRVKPGMT